MTDLNLIARDLTRFLPNALVDVERTNRHEAHLIVGDLAIRIDARQSGRIEVRGFTRLGQGVLHYSDIPAMGKLTAAADKRPEIIAREITRKIIEPAQPLLDSVRTKLERHTVARAGLEHFRAVTAMHMPYARIGEPRDANATTCAISAHKGDCYLSGELRDDGSIYVRNLGNIPAGRVAAVMAALFD